MMSENPSSVTTQQPSSSPYYTFKDALPAQRSSSTSGHGYNPPVGQWRDGICDCMTNLWPSCCCVASGGYSGGCMSMFYAGQISTRIGWFDTLTVLVVYALFVGFFWFIGFIIVATVPPQNGQAASLLLFWFPYFCAFIFLMLLRVKFVARFQIPEDPLETFCVGFWCSSCSLCQMGRHLYGYTRLFDGDGMLDGGMQYHQVASSEPPALPYTQTYAPPLSPPVVATNSPLAQQQPVATYSV